MTAPIPQSQPKGEPVRDYVIRRGGGFYRHGAAGYTQSLGEAGRWTKTEAGMFAVGCEGVTIHHVSEFPPDEIASLRAKVDELTAALGESRGQLTKLAAECHRAKWEFDLSDDFKPSAKYARALILTAFRQLHRIGDLAITAVKASVVNSQHSDGEAT